MTLKEFRRSLNLTQEQFADKVQVSRITIARLEADSSAIKAELIKRIMEVFQLPLDEAWQMFYGEDDEA